MTKEKTKLRRFEKYWDKKGKQDFFTWIHRYLRLHRELLEDNIYQNIYDYFRNTLIACLKKDLKKKKTNDIEIGKVVDILADVFNREGAEYVNKYKPCVDELYKLWKEYPDMTKNIYV